MPATHSTRRRKVERSLVAYHRRYLEGWQLNEIAEELGVSPVHARRLALDGAKLLVGEELRESARAGALAELDALRSKAYGWMQGEYVVTSFGKVVCNVEGHPLKDIAPNLAALDRILRIEKRRAEIFGYDAPKRTAINVVTEDAVVAEIRRIEGELAQADGEASRLRDDP